MTASYKLRRLSISQALFAMDTQKMALWISLPASSQDQRAGLAHLCP
jgi:hypothetical protein